MASLSEKDRATVLFLNLEYTFFNTEYNIVYNFLYIKKYHCV